jgi:hypothetical protein
MKYMPLLPIIFGIFSLTLGYYLEAEVIRFLWLIGSSLMVVMGMFAMIMIQAMLSDLKKGEHLPYCPCNEIFNQKKNRFPSQSEPI